MPVKFYDHIDRTNGATTIFALQINPDRPGVAVVSEIEENKGPHVSQLRNMFAARFVNDFNRPIEEIAFYQQDVRAGTFGRWVVPNEPAKPVIPWRPDIEAGASQPAAQPLFVNATIAEAEELLGERIHVPPLRPAPPVQEAGVAELYYAQRTFMDSNGRSVTCHLRLYMEQPEGGQGTTAQPVLIVTQHPKSESVGGILDMSIEHQILTEMEARFSNHHLNPRDLLYVQCWPAGSRETGFGYGRNQFEYYEKRDVFMSDGMYGTQRAAPRPNDTERYLFSRPEVSELIGGHSLDVPEIGRPPVRVQIEMTQDALALKSYLAREERMEAEDQRLAQALNKELMTAYLHHFNMPALDRKAIRQSLERGQAGASPAAGDVQPKDDSNPGARPRKEPINQGTTRVAPDPRETDQDRAEETKPDHGMGR